MNSTIDGTVTTIRLVELEKIIEAGSKTFVEVGLALAEIRDSGLYKSEFNTFQDYCFHKWGWTKQHCYRLIECAPVAKSNPQVTSLNQARALTKVPAEKRAEVIRTAQEQASANGRKMTAQDVALASCVGTAQSKLAYKPKTHAQTESWFFHANKTKRAKILEHFFMFDIEVENRSQFKQRVESWLETRVKEKASR